MDVVQNATSFTSRNIDNCKELIYRIIRLKWTILDQNIAKSYIQFVHLMVTSYPEFETDIIEVNVKTFLTPGKIKTKNDPIKYC